jgi:hypothetical protein
MKPYKGLPRKRSLGKKPKNKVVKSKKDLREFKKAVWQYLLDHAQPKSKGFQISFLIPNEREFFKRVKARHRKVYKRVDTKKIEEKREKLAVQDKEFLKVEKKKYQARKKMRHKPEPIDELILAIENRIKVIKKERQLEIAEKEFNLNRESELNINFWIEN